MRPALSSRFLRSSVYSRFALAAVGVLLLGSIAVRAETLRVVTTTPVLADFVHEIGGDAVDVTSLIKPGVDPHEFDPTPSDLKAAGQAQIILVSGKGLEHFLPKLKSNLDAKAVWLDVGGLVPSLKRDDSHGQQVQDPHWWHSIVNAKTAVIGITGALAKALPDHAAEIQARGQAYGEKLDDLARQVRVKVAELPRTERKLVTSHDALQYFAKEFGFTIYPITGVSTEEEATSQAIAAMITTIRAQEVKAVFFEDTQNPKVIEQITRETGAKVGGELYADGLGTGATGTYVGMIQANVATIVDALK